jgi:hypothetical protein
MLGERRERQLDEHSGLTRTVVYANLTVRKRPAHVTVNPVRVPQQASAA